MNESNSFRRVKNFSISKIYHLDNERTSHRLRENVGSAFFRQKIISRIY